MHQVTSEDVLKGNAKKASLRVQLAKFTLTGGGTAVIDWGLTMLLQTLGLHRQVAKAFGWSAGTLVAYLVNSKWTFNAAVTRSSALAVGVLYLSTFGIQNLLYWVLDSPLQALGMTGMLKDTIAFVIAQAVATVTNFAIQRVLIFRD